MSGTLLLIVSGICLTAAYLLYGRYLAKKWKIDPNHKTPAHELNDGVDYVPTRRAIVFGHHFATIAGAGPINGPIIAAMFGWVPVLLWILIGGIFIGAAHDFAAMYASVKNKGRTIGYVIELYIGKVGKKLFMLFAWLFTILIIAAFADIAAGTFNGFTTDDTPIPANASVATTSILFMVVAIAFGFYIRTKPSNLPLVIVANVLLTFCIVLGLGFPIFATQSFWLYFIFAYIFVAAVTPVWVLMQPRDFLNTFLLLGLMVSAIIGVFITNPAIHITPFAGFCVEFKGQNNYLFPILFVTVACGAVSGFHALAASGTASKQIDNERDMLPVSFGAMLIESLLAVIALIAVGAVAIGGVIPDKVPPVIFAEAIAGFLSGLGLPPTIVYTLIALAISAFVLTTLDSVARIGRMSFQEFFMTDEKASLFVRILTNKYLATTLTLIPGYLLATRGYQSIWPLFGSANQLLAALTLIACAVFLKKTKRGGAMLYVPFVFMLLVTFSALGMSIYKLLAKLPSDFNIAADGTQLFFAVLLSALGVVVAIRGIGALRSKNTEVHSE